MYIYVHYQYIRDTILVFITTLFSHITYTNKWKKWYHFIVYVVHLYQDFSIQVFIDIMTLFGKRYHPKALSMSFDFQFDKTF